MDSCQQSSLANTPSPKWSNKLRIAPIMHISTAGEHFPQNSINNLPRSYCRVRTIIKIRTKKKYYPLSFPPSFLPSLPAPFLSFSCIPLSLPVCLSSSLLSFFSVAFFTVSPCFSSLDLLSNTPAVPRGIIFFVSEEQGHLGF